MHEHEVDLGTFIAPAIGTMPERPMRRYECQDCGHLRFEKEDGGQTA